MFTIGWSQCDLTPDRPVLLAGQFHARVSEGVMDPVTATALAIESAPPGAPPERAVLVSCDLVAIPDGLRDAVRARVARLVPELGPTDVILNATHTHTAPDLRVESDSLQTGGGTVPVALGVELPAMPPKEYADFAARRIAETVAAAWSARAPTAFAYGLGHAVVGRNRRITYYSGETRMYGKTHDPLFSHVEGGEDHSVNVMAFWRGPRLTGLVVNVPCPSQVSEQAYQLSADYWHETRVELRRRLGAELFILPQNSATGDQSPHILINKAAEERMWRLAGRSQRQEIALRIADAVTGVLPLIEKERADAPVFKRRAAVVELARRDLTEQDVAEALAEAAKAREQLAAALRDLAADPAKRQQPRWYVAVTAAHRRVKWNEGVAERFARRKTQPRLPVEFHVLRLGDAAVATNPFEYYLDFGLQIKARSPAVQTFLVQHTGSGTYCPTLRATAGKSYGALPASTPVGPEGGRELVEHSVAALKDLWKG
jgi:hypothetical protein